MKIILFWFKLHKSLLRQLLNRHPAITLTSDDFSDADKQYPASVCHSTDILGMQLIIHAPNKQRYEEYN